MGKRIRFGENPGTRASLRQYQFFFMSSHPLVMFTSSHLLVMLTSSRPLVMFSFKLHIILCSGSGYMQSFVNMSYGQRYVNEKPKSSSLPGLGPHFECV